MSLGQAIAEAVTGALRETFGGTGKGNGRKIPRYVQRALKETADCDRAQVRKPVVERKSRKVRRDKAVKPEPKRKVTVSKVPAVRPFEKGEYDALVMAACVDWKTVAEMRKHVGLTGVIASRLSTKCLAMLRAGKLTRRERNWTPLEFEYRIIGAAR